MAGYNDIAAFKLLSVMPASDIDARETAQPGYVTKQLGSAGGYINAQLSKRYVVPFTNLPDDSIVYRWESDIATYRIWQRRGWDATDDQVEQIKEDHDRALAELQKAADAVTGLYDLPLANGSSGISKGKPRVYSEASPYVGFDVQGETGRTEDRGRSGTGG